MTATLQPMPLTEQQHIVLEDVSWSLYEKLLEEVGNRPLRLTFDRGRLEIMAPLPLHEKWKTRLGRLIETLSLELNIPVEALGSTTFRREDLAKGLEPDECYYVQNAAAVRGKDELDLNVDPAPDLAVEIGIKRRSVAREPIYAALGVPELWRFDGRKLTVLRLDADGRYRPAPASGVFPFLPWDCFQGFVERLKTEEQTAVLRDFRDWVRTLKP